MLSSLQDKNFSFHIVVTENKNTVEHSMKAFARIKYVRKKVKKHEYYKFVVAWDILATHIMLKG